MVDLQLQTGSSGGNKGLTFDVSQFEYDTLIGAYFDEIERKETMTRQEAIEYIRNGGDVGLAAKRYIDNLEIETDENPIVLLCRIRSELVKMSAGDI